MQRVRYSLYCIDRTFRCSDIRPCGSVLRSADPLSPPRACFNININMLPYFWNGMPCNIRYHSYQDARKGTGEGEEGRQEKR